MIIIIFPINVTIVVWIVSILAVYLQHHDINFEEDSEKNPSPRWDLNPRPSVI